MKVQNHLRCHTLITISFPPETTIPYFALNFTVEMKCSWASIFFFYFPKFKSHILMVLSSEQEYRYLPEECNDKLRIQLSCPVKV